MHSSFRFSDFSKGEALALYIMFAFLFLFKLSNSYYVASYGSTPTVAITNNIAVAFLAFQILWIVPRSLSRFYEDKRKAPLHLQCLLTYVNAPLAVVALLFNLAHTEIKQRLFMRVSVEEFTSYQAFMRDIALSSSSVGPETMRIINLSPEEIAMEVKINIFQIMLDIFKTKPLDSFLWTVLAVILTSVVVYDIRSLHWKCVKASKAGPTNQLF